ncbi:hypothetical protein CLV56_3215 [Mumia flava]|uniref:PknH-like protein n=1 Tax=Mumia flava TaxID=1348852 RepID=A0A0B2BEW8_9ACTN|nr:hypothetical protein [Mumia flava]PJJ53723.1 hypothetical protein CLV56_3215 [Mumia flava]
MPGDPAEPGSRRVPTALVGVLVAAAVVLAASACSLLPNDEPVAEPVLLTDQELATALLTVDEVGPQYTETEPTGAYGGLGGSGCLTRLDALASDDDTAPADRTARAGIEYAATRDLGTRHIISRTASYGSASAASEALGSLRDTFEGCDEVDVTDDEGTRVVATVRTDDDPALETVDEQLNVTVEGVVGPGDFPLVFGFRYSFVRLHNNLLTVAVVDLGSPAEGPHAALTQTAVVRLASVASGEKPPVPDDGDDTANASVQPLDGGIYTWESGVSMRVSLVDVGPWGGQGCDDGCEGARPDDLRVVLRYAVAVPADGARAFDPAACPGPLKAASAEDAAAPRLVKTSDARRLETPVAPGTAASGTVVYLIDPAYADEPFFVDSTCGDPDGQELASFEGTLSGER